MSETSATLRKIFDEARPLVEQALDLTEQFAAFRELATNNGLDWSQIKALLKAQVQDERAGEDGKRVDRIIEKADFASAYADMLGLGTKMNENNFSADPPHDPITGEIIETDADCNSAEAGPGSDGAAGEGAGCNDTVVASPPIQEPLAPSGDAASGDDEGDTSLALSAAPIHDLSDPGGIPDCLRRTAA